MQGLVAIENITQLNKANRCAKLPHALEDHGHNFSGLFDKILDWNPFLLILETNFVKWAMLEPYQAPQCWEEVLNHAQPRIKVLI